MTDDRLLTLDEVAELARVSRRTVQREIVRGRLRAVKIERSIRVRETEARRWAGLGDLAHEYSELRRAT